MNKKVDTSRKLHELIKILHNLGSLVVAFSGGTDSTFLLKVAKDALDDRVIAATGLSATYPDEEYQEARKIVKILGVKHVIVDTEELSSPQFCSNPPDRCYYCKKELFEKLKEVALRENIAHIADGSNLDDMSDFRPGILAAREMGVVSPLKDAKLSKNEIRSLSRKMNLATWDKPSFACLASRFPYQEKIDLKKLQMVIEAESFLGKTLNTRQLRVRHHFPIARIEIPENKIGQFADKDLRDRVINKLNEIGYIYITLDLAGFRSGSMNEVLKKI